MSQKTKILVVDDEEVVRRSYVKSLAGQNCSVEVATNGQDALRAMGESAFDVVLLDLLMPGLSGMSVLRTIKQNWPESEVVIITGYPALESAKEALTLGAFDYLSKPVGPQDIIHAASNAMTRKSWALRRVQSGSCTKLQ